LPLLNEHRGSSTNPGAVFLTALQRAGCSPDRRRRTATFRLARSWLGEVSKMAKTKQPNRQLLELSTPLPVPHVCRQPAAPFSSVCFLFSPTDAAWPQAWVMLVPPQSHGGWRGTGEKPGGGFSPTQVPCGKELAEPQVRKEQPGSEARAGSGVCKPRCGTLLCLLPQHPVPSPC